MDHDQSWADGASELIDQPGPMKAGRRRIPGAAVSDVPSTCVSVFVAPNFHTMSEDLRAELEKCLQTLNIQTSCVEHPPVFTVEEMMPHLQEVSGAVTKNLFLKDKKKKTLWLVSARHDRSVNLNNLAKKLGVGSGNLRFADEAAMLEKLKVGQGCATALALLFDEDQSVKLVLDRDLVEGGHQMVYFHPMTNAATMGLRPDDLLRFLKETGHEPILESFE
ncbi:prolyl-tRNA synthetase associated domain-containing protein 1-like [Melanotaenia boesemani]|uniref:prolyl-tRNA synthetase associated domain-containing protein 1-like n=1 Tax=Melanotaenia boesemani TaxID=1250792 RepID=UPI001C0566E5|nr:prolyl-tRNA synthetase associated domain-containing protein 1-like [Melanotaenia boesemani]